MLQGLLILASVLVLAVSSRRRSPQDGVIKPDSCSGIAEGCFPDFF